MGLAHEPGPHHPGGSAADRPRAAASLVGRDAELERIETVLAQHPGAPHGVLLHGHEGIGKTMLWSEAIRRARQSGYRVLESALTHAESSLAFAGLADLLQPVLDEVLPGLAAPRAAALQTALAIEPGESGPPDERVVAFGFRAALSTLASSSPIALAIDDIQWLDPSSMLMLSYAIRRMRREPLLLLLARRDGVAADRSAWLTDGSGPSLERMFVGPLPLGAIHRLIRLRLGASLTRPQLLRIHAASEGNPLHALELARAINASPELNPDPLMTLLTDRVAALPERTRLALALGAIATDTDLEVLSAAHGSAPLLEDLEPAIDAELVSIGGGRLRFSHPLVASAAEATATPGARRALHLALAGVATSNEARAAHLANARSAPDADVARDVEATAHATRSRGARATSAALFEAAARLTLPSDQADRARRHLAAAEGWYEAGDLALAERILERLLDELGPGAQRCEAAWRLGVLRDEAGNWQDATALWRDALAETDHPGLAARLQCSLAMTASYTGSVGEAVVWADAAVVSAERSPDRVDLARALAMQALMRALSGTADYAAPLERALALEAENGEFLGDWSPSAVAAECARHTGDVRGALRYFGLLLDRARDAGDANVEQWAAFGLASSELLAGGFERAADLADIVQDIADQTGQMRIPARSLRAHVDGYLGRIESARALAREAIASATAADERVHLAVAHTALATIETCAGDMGAAARAYGAAREIGAGIGLAHAGAMRACLNEAEAAAAAGLTDQAEAAMAAFAAMSKGTPPPWSDGLVRRARASILSTKGDLRSAQLELEAALPLDDELPLDQARTLLALGLVYRRLRERARARETLGSALDLFTRLGTPAWVDRARTEISRISGRRPSESDDLTEAESRIADLVATGHSNREVAAALFLSVKTVEVTLTRIYQKLGVRSRAQLGNLLGASTKQ